jgi:UDP-glucose 4-epimerase
MKIFVTGANGFIGSAVSIGMAGRGHNVLALSRQAMSHVQLPPTLSPLQTLITKEAIGPLLAEQSPDTLIHCVGASTVYQAQEAPHQDYLNTVCSVAEMLEAIRTHSKNTVFILISSASVYGDRNGDRLTETLIPQPISVYGYNKWLAELLVQQYATQFGVATLVVRPFSVYGEGLKKQVIFDICRKIVDSSKSIQIDGTGNEIRDFIHIDDVVTGIAHLVQYRQTGTINLGTGQPTKLVELVKWLIEQLAPQMDFSFTGKPSLRNPQSLLADTSLAELLGIHPVINIEEGLMRVSNEFVHELRGR